MTVAKILRRPPFTLVLLAITTTLAGCYTGLGAPDRSNADGAGGDDNGGDGQDDGPAPSRTPADPGEIHPFEVPGSEVELLPFHVRINNLATVAGVSPDHPMFTDLYIRRYQLGDHDYANGIAPDLRWTPERMETWVRGLKSVCDDPAFQSRNSGIVADPTELVRAAFAREPTDEELSALQEVIAGQVDPAGQYRMVCLTVLTSLEFVAR